MTVVAVDEPRYGEALLEELELDEVEELWAGDDDADHTGWFCVSTDPLRPRMVTSVRGFMRP